MAKTEVMTSGFFFYLNPYLTTEQTTVLFFSVRLSENQDSNPRHILYHTLTSLVRRYLRLLFCGLVAITMYRKKDPDCYNPHSKHYKDNLSTKKLPDELQCEESSKIIKILKTPGEQSKVPKHL